MPIKYTAAPLPAVNYCSTHSSSLGRLQMTDSLWHAWKHFPSIEKIKGSKLSGTLWRKSQTHVLHLLFSNSCYSNSVFWLCFIKVLIPSPAENLSLVDFKGTTYILMDKLSLVIYLYWEQDLDASSSQASVKRYVSRPENAVLESY